MRVLLDECVPRRLIRELPAHHARTVPEVGWAGLPDGELLRRAAERFDAFVTVDRNLAFQDNVSGAAIGVVVLVAESHAIGAFAPLVPVLQAVLPTLGRGRVVRITRLGGAGAVSGG